MKKLPILLGVIIILLLSGIVLLVLFPFPKTESQENPIAQNPIISQESSNNKNNVMPVYNVENLDILIENKELNISDYYCKYCDTGLNIFYIDNENNLWGNGENKNGQLGIGSLDEVIEQKGKKIAENVISVTSSPNGYFTVFLTEDKKLYGMGSNRQGLLLQPYIKECSESQYTKLLEPILLMEEVEYACVGSSSIVVLKSDKSVWWWGEYQLPGITDPNLKMLADTPQKMLENCNYIVAGNENVAVLTQNGDLYTWGLNQYGQCGLPDIKQKIIYEPIKILENVNMIYMDKIGKPYSEKNFSKITKNHTTYKNTLFAQMKDGRILACGENLSYSYMYTDSTPQAENTYTIFKSFSEISVKEFSEKELEKQLKSLKIGMSKSEVKRILDQNDFFYCEIYGADKNIENNELIEIGYSLEDDYCHLFFGTDEKLEKIEQNIEE